MSVQYILYIYVYLTPDTWHLTPDTWHMTCDTWWGFNIVTKRFGIYDVLMIGRESISRSLNQSIIDKAVCRAAPTTSVNNCSKLGKRLACISFINLYREKFILQTGTKSKHKIYSKKRLDEQLCNIFIENKTFTNVNKKSFKINILNRL